jgi:acyl-coenzyme A synthetase/AMP-(fatty) acid ligase
MRKVTEMEDLYELVQTRETNLRGIQGVFTTYSNLQESPTRDLFTKHPTKPHHWIYECRADDCLVFTNSYKVNLLPLEVLLETHPAIQTAVNIGQRRPSITAIVEFSDNHREKVRERDSSSISCQSSRSTIERKGMWTLSIDRIIFTIKPLPRNRKGGLIRRKVVEDFLEEIEMRYGNGSSPEL